MSDILLTDDPAPHVRRLTLNRPEKRNALSNPLRGELFAALEAADRDPEVRVIVLRGAGTCFSSGYDLAGLGPLPFHTAGDFGLASMLKSGRGGRTVRRYAWAGLPWPRESATRT